jgi:iron(III) transport system permease protein
MLQFHTSKRLARKAVNWPRIVSLATAAVVVYLVAAPLAVALIASFRQQGVLPFEAGTFTLENYAKVFLEPGTLRILWNTLCFAIGSLAIGVTLAVYLSWLIERSDLPHRGPLFALIVAPLVIPGMLFAMAWIFLLEPQIGIFNKIFQSLAGNPGRGPFNIYSLAGMVFVEGIRMVPTVFLMTSAAFRSMDPALEEASRVAGKSLMMTSFRITLPVMRPAILAAFIYYFIVVLEVFEIPGVLGMNAGIFVLSTRIYWAAHPTIGLPDYGLASTLGLVLVACAVALIWVYFRSTKRSYKFVTVTGRGYLPETVSLGKWKYPALLFVGVYVLVTLIAPLMVLAWTSLNPYYVVPSWDSLSRISLNTYQELLLYPGVWLAFGNTLLLCLGTATITMAISFFVAWVATYDQSKLGRMLDVTAFLPHALPTVVIALGVMLFYLSFRNPFYGTIVVISIALTTRYVAYGSRTMMSSFIQIHPELQEASRVAGASWLRTYWRIFLPLTAPAFINGWIWVAIQTGRELTASLMLFTPSSVVVSTSIWSQWQQGEISIASAMGVVLTVVLGLLSWLGRLTLSKLRVV